MSVTITVDMEGQRLKSAALRAVPRAFRDNATAWASETLRYIKNSYKGGAVFKRPPKEIDQRLGMKVLMITPDRAEIVLGTGGVIGKEEVVYAGIQERGGIIVPRTKKYLTIPFPGVKGRAANYPGIFRPKGHDVLGVSEGGKFKGLFALATSVQLPARHWFTRPIAERMPELRRMMSPEAVWARAMQIGYARTAAQGGKA